MKDTKKTPDIRRRFFQPDMMFASIYDITPAVLVSEGYRAVIFDIDNTVAAYETATPTPAMRAYFASLEEAGLKIAFVSNNKAARVELFNKGFGYFAVSRAKKPFSRGINTCIKHFGLSKEQVVSVGDQLFTDCMAAHSAGLDFYMVAPVNKKESGFFRFKRTLEKPFIHAFHRRRRTKK